VPDRGTGQREKHGGAEARIAMTLRPGLGPDCGTGSGMDASSLGAGPVPAAPLAAVPPGTKKPLSPASRRAYEADWAAFSAWCAASGRVALPADAATLAAYLKNPATAGSRHPAARGRRRGTLDRWLAAIAHAHRARGFAAPTDDPTVRKLLRATKRQVAIGPRPAPPAAAQLLRMAAACPGDLAGLRDRALLLLAAATGLGRKVLVGLDAEHVRIDAAAAEFSLLAAGEGRAGMRNIVVPRNPVLDGPGSRSTGLCPVGALEDWLGASDTRFGPVFRKIDRWGNVEHRRLGTDALRRILLARRAKRLKATSAKNRADQSSQDAGGAAAPGPKRRHGDSPGDRDTPVTGRAR
jgi:hypothetical protein